ncbi:MAG: ABC transporter ATP-binding protein [Bacteroidales bacterium]
MSNSTVEIRNLSIGYNRKQEKDKIQSRNNTPNIKKVVAQGINAHIFNGELTCLLGANGVGKSTLLKTLSAFLPKITGEIKILGKDIEKYSAKELSKILSIVLTDKCDVKNMTVTELIGLGRSPYTGFWGTLNKEDNLIVKESISLIGIDNLTQRMVHTLSDGEKQKVMIAKALVQQTPIIFLDEPTAFLDFPSKVEIMQLLHSLTRKTGKTIFLSTHDLELALQIADKIWLMDKTNGFAIGTPEDLAITGHLSNFFAQKGIIFDNETGLFRVDNKYNSRINLQGKHGNIHAMVRKALMRNGILAGRNEESNIQIIIEEGPIPKFTINNNNSKKTVETIEDLLAQVLTYIN